MNRVKGICIAMALLLAGLYGCTKKGDTGAAGATGATGTANVMYSGWQTLNMSFNADDSAYEQTIVADSITQAVLDSGLVLSYIKYTNASNVQQVESASTYMQEILSLKAINLYSYYYDLSGVPFRYIVVKGGAAINGRLSNTLQGYTKEAWKAMSYDEVVSILGLTK